MEITTNTPALAVALDFLGFRPTGAAEAAGDGPTWIDRYIPPSSRPGLKRLSATVRSGVNLIDHANTAASMALLALNLGARLYTPLRSAAILTTLASAAAPWLMRTTAATTLYRMIDRSEYTHLGHYLSLLGVYMSLNSLRELKWIAAEVEKIRDFQAVIPHENLTKGYLKYVELISFRQLAALRVDAADALYTGALSLHQAYTESRDATLSDPDRQTRNRDRMLQALFRFGMLTLNYRDIQATSFYAPISVPPTAPVAGFRTPAPDRADITLLSVDLKVGAAGHLTLLELNDGLQSGYKGYNALHPDKPAETLIYKYLQAKAAGKPVLFVPQQPPFPPPNRFPQFYVPWTQTHSNPHRFAGNALGHDGSYALTLDAFENQYGYVGLKLGESSAQAASFRSGECLTELSSAEAVIVSMGSRTYTAGDPLVTRAKEAGLKLDGYDFWNHFFDESRFIQVNHPHAIHFASDKVLLHRALNQLGLSRYHPDTLELLPRSQWTLTNLFKMALEIHGFALRHPGRLVVKPTTLCQGNGVLIAEDRILLDGIVTLFRKEKRRQDAILRLGQELEAAEVAEALASRSIVRRLTRPLRTRWNKWTFSLLERQTQRAYLQDLQKSGATLPFDRAVQDTYTPWDACRLYFEALYHQFPDVPLVLQNYVPSQAVAVTHNGNTDFYDSTIRVFFALERSGGQDRFTPFGAYHKLPAKPLSDDGPHATFNAGLSRVDPDRPDLPTSAPVDHDLYRQIVPELEKVMLALYPMIRHPSLLKNP